MPGEPAEAEKGPRDRVQLPWETEGHYTEEVRRRRASPEVQEIIAREMGTRGLMGSSVAPSLYFSPNANNPYFLIAYGLMFLSIPVAIGIMQESYELFFWLFLFLGAVGIWMVYLGAVRVGRWHKARREVRIYVDRNHEPFPDELKWNR